MVMAIFALLLAGIGLYGLVSQEVLERRGEMGVRMALGASPGAAVFRTGAAGIRLAITGLALGILLSWGAARALQTLIYGVGAFDPVTALGVVAVLVSIATVASFIPAARIGRMDPARVLREE